MEDTSPISALQPEILNQIFHKLPIRSVFYCQLVCKQWLSLISDPLFKSSYNPSTIPNNPLNLMMIPSSTFGKIPATCYEIDSSNNPPTRHPQPLPHDFTLCEQTAILGSYNGFVALYQDHGKFCLFNPCTGEEKTVHVQTMHEKLKMNWCADLLFGLCYDSITKNYKGVLSVSSRGSCGFYLVSFNDGDWKLKTQSGLQHPSYCTNTELGTIVNGVPHWTSGDSLFCFDQEQEEFWMILKPDEWGRRKICGLGGLDGQLTVGVIGNGLEIWAMKEYGNEKSWSNLFVIANDQFRSVSLLAWMKDDDDILIDVNQQELMVYNVGSQSLRQVERKMWRTLYKIVTYAPSLVCLA